MKVDKAPNKKNKKDIQKKVEGVATPPPAQFDTTSNENINKILQDSLEKYQEVAAAVLKKNKSEFDTLLPIVSEYLEDFIIIGHTVAGERITLRYASTPRELDALLEASKRILMMMLAQEADMDR